MAKKISEEDDLARRFFALWAEYLAALAADPKMTEALRRWLAIAAGALQNPSPGDAPPGSPTGAATAAGAFGERDAAVAELARRVDELGRRVAALERPGEPPGERNGKPNRRAADGARRRNPASRS